MTSFCALLLDRRALTAADLDRALLGQLARGGDVAGSVLQIGAVKENALLRLLADYYEMPAGPKGRLDEPTPEMMDAISPAAMRRYRICPYRRTARTLHVACAGPLDPDAERELRAAANLQLRPAVVPSVRLSEALWRYAGAPLPAYARAVIEAHDQQRANSPGGPPSYRRMSERPEGVRVSNRQPSGARDVPATPPEGEAHAVDDRQEPAVDAAIEARRQAALGMRAAPPRQLITPPPPLSTPPERRASESPGTPPPAKIRSEDSQANGVRRPTPPPPSLSRSDAAEAPSEMKRRGVSMPPRRNLIREMAASPPGDEPASLRSEVIRSLPPHGAGRRFRHHGPLSFEDAASAVSDASEASVVLDVAARFARQYFERTILFAVAGDRIEVRAAYGAAVELPALSLAAGGGGLLGRACLGAKPLIDALGFEGADAVVRAQLKQSDAVSAAAIPLCIRGRAIALLYGDDLDQPVDPAAVAVVGDFCGACADELARIAIARKKR